jgi:hypothetical protein
VSLTLLSRQHIIYSLDQRSFLSQASCLCPRCLSSYTASRQKCKHTQSMSLRDALTRSIRAACGLQHVSQTPSRLASTHSSCAGSCWDKTADFLRLRSGSGDGPSLAGDTGRYAEQRLARTRTLRIYVLMPDDAAPADLLSSWPWRDPSGPVDHCTLTASSLPHADKCGPLFSVSRSHQEQLRFRPADRWQVLLPGCWS